MTCLACGHTLPEGAKFCPECGTPSAALCANCGVELPPAAKFCAECGAAVASTASARAKPQPTSREPRDYTPKHLADKILQSKSALEGERKQVTVMFADVKGSMDLAEQLDPEQWHEILERFFEILTDGVHRFEGTVNQYTGDGIMALFGAPIAHEDHAQRACYAALQLRDEIARYATEVKRTHGLSFSTRMGLNSGEVVVGSIGDDLRMDYTAQGHTVGLAQRMESLASPDTCYLSPATAQLVEGYFTLGDLGPFQIKGVSDQINVFELLDRGVMRSRFDIAHSRGLSRFVGRDTDMQTLESALAQAQSGNGQVVGIVADPGTGKSRLCFEFLESCRARGLTINIGRAVAHGKHIPLLPMLEIFRSYYGITDSDSDQLVREKIAGRLLLIDESFRDVLPIVFEVFGVSDPDHPPARMDPDAKQRQLFEVVRKIVRQQDGAGKRIWLIEDLHWLDPGSTAFLEQWVDAVAGSCGLLIVNFRPEFHAEWMSKSYYRQLPLAPLGPDALRVLVNDLLGEDPSTNGLADAIHTRTGGNPFFTEEVVQSLIESGALAGSRGRYRLVTPLAQLQVPPTVQALLASRIDRLAEREKRVLQAAAVIGKDFPEPILAAVCDMPLDDLRAALRTLNDAEFIFEEALYPVAEYAFKHPLTQEVAYQSQLQSRRAIVHARVARAIEAHAGDKLDEQAALLAHHCEGAGEVLNAARWHQRAAEWAGMNDMDAALRHWFRVRDLAKQGGDDPESTALLAIACSQVLPFGWRVGGSTTEWAEIFEEGCAAATKTENLAALATLNTVYGAVRGNNNAAPLDFVRYTTEAVRIADGTGDTALRAGTRAPLLFGNMIWGRLEEVEQVADDIIALACDDPDLGAEVAGFSPLMAARGIRPFAVGSLRDPVSALREFPVARRAAMEAGYPEQALWALTWETELKYALGHTDGIHTLAQTAMRLAEDLGAINEILASISQYDALACDNAWSDLLDAATNTLIETRERSVGRMWEARLLGLIGSAQLELGHSEASHAAAEEAVVFMREYQLVLNPHGYAILVRAQLALNQSAAGITNTLDEYESLLTRTGFHVYEGELHELRAQLAEREGQNDERTEALAHAHNCYTRFAMIDQAERINALQITASSV